MPILQDTKEHTLQTVKAMHLLSALQSNTMTFVLEPFYKLSFPTSSFHSDLTTTCTVLVGIQKCCCSMAPHLQSYVEWWMPNSKKPHCCCYIQNNHLTSIYGNMKLDLLKSWIQNTKRKSKSWSQFLPLFQQKCVCPCLAQLHSCHKWLFFPFLIWSVVKCFFIFFQSFVWMKFTA